MRFLCDVHIPKKLVHHLLDIGYDARHVNDMPNRWYSSDMEIATYADEGDFIVISKDADFKDSYLISGSPKKLVKVSLGNISNQVLIDMITAQLPSLGALYDKGSFLVELDNRMGATVIDEIPL